MRSKESICIYAARALRTSKVLVGVVPPWPMGEMEVKVGRGGHSLP